MVASKRLKGERTKGGMRVSRKIMLSKGELCISLNMGKKGKGRAFGRSKLIIGGGRTREEARQAVRAVDSTGAG